MMGIDIVGQDIAMQIADEMKKGETNRMEFKSELPEDHIRYLKSVIAFSNSFGGKILFGVNNDGSIAGIPDETLFVIKDAIADSIINSCQPQIVPDIFVITLDEKNVIVVYVLPGKNSPYFLKSAGMKRGTYIRVGATNRLADENGIKTLELRGRRMSFDGLDCPSVTIDKLHLTSLCRHLSSFGKDVTEMNLVNMNVLKEGTSGYIPTNAYALLTTNPFPYACVKCARFRGTDDSVFVDRKEFEGSIVDQVTNSLDFVINHINVGAKIEGLVREDIYEIPKDALRECIVNAVVHRDYLMDGSSVFIRVFDDRIEIESPGQPLGLNADEPLSGRSVIRNPAIASVFKTIGFIEAYGTGIRKIMRSCRSAGLKDPKFIEDDLYFKVIFFRSRSKTNSAYEDEQKAAIVRAISKDPTLTQQGISDITGVPLSRIKKLMPVLQEDGTIERIGSRKKPIWKVNEQ